MKFSTVFDHVNSAKVWENVVLKLMKLIFLTGDGENLVAQRQGHYCWEHVWEHGSKYAYFRIFKDKVQISGMSVKWEACEYRCCIFQHSV